MLDNDRVIKLNERIEKMEQELEQATDKRKKAEEKEKKISEELERYKNQKAAMKMEEITASLGSNGLNLEDIMSALKDGSLEILQAKIQEHNKKKK